jgi:hypothetical protein
MFYFQCLLFRRITALLEEIVNMDEKLYDVRIFKNNSY